MKVTIENKLSTNYVWDLLQDKDLTPSFLHVNIDKEQYSTKLSKNAFFITLEEDNRVLAFAAYYLNDISKALFITLITIHKIYRRKGVGNKILKLLSTYYDGKYEYIDLEVDNNNTAAYNFYINNGFVKLSSSNEKTQLRVEIVKLLKN